MNFVYLVESGKYDPNDLDQERWQFCNGIKTAIDEIDGAVNLEYQTFDDTPIHQAVMNSFAEEVAEHIKDYLYSSYCEAVVCLLDEQSAEEENAKPGNDS